MSLLEYMYGKKEDWQEGDEQRTSTTIVQPNKSRLMKKLMHQTGLSEVEIRSQRKFIMMFRAQKRKSISKNKLSHCVQ